MMPRARALARCRGDKAACVPGGRGRAGFVRQRSEILFLKGALKWGPDIRVERQHSSTRMMKVEANSVHDPQELLWPDGNATHCT